MSYFEDEEMDPVDAEADTAIRKAADGMTATVLLPDHLLHTIAASIATRLEASIKARIEKDVAKKLTEMVDAAVAKVIGDRVEALVVEAIEKPRQKTDSWGNPSGPVTTFAELIPGIVEAHLKEPVDAKGNRITDSFGRRDATATRTSWIISQAVREHLDPVTKSAVETVAKQARDVVSQQIAAFVSEKMMPAIEARRS